MIMTANLKQALEDYRNLTLELNDLAATKIFNSVIGPYAEVLTCVALGLTLAKSQVQSGYDATDEQEKVRYQIKVRHREKDEDVKFEKLKMNPDGTMAFHYLIAIFMDKQHKVTEAYKIPASCIETNGVSDENGKYKTLFWKKPICEKICNDSRVKDITSLY
ncbi:MAG: hypothetical protein K5982_02915 [Selenomonadaceae bacterium]|nr:hypothetical protein [Selenomonadaceae bacterium]